jgi:hypothetical protein
MIVQDLEQAGVLLKERRGRRNHYVLRTEQQLRHPIEEHRTVSDLLELLAREEPAN